MISAFRAGNWQKTSCEHRRSLAILAEFFCRKFLNYNGIYKCDHFPSTLIQPDHFGPAVAISVHFTSGVLMHVQLGTELLDKKFSVIKNSSRQYAPTNPGDLLSCFNIQRNTSCEMQINGFMDDCKSQMLDQIRRPFLFGIMVDNFIHADLTKESASV